jgi:hypothetical protein
VSLCVDLPHPISIPTWRGLISMNLESDGSLSSRGPFPNRYAKRKPETPVLIPAFCVGVLGVFPWARGQSVLDSNPPDLFLRFIPSLLRNQFFDLHTVRANNGTGPSPG